MPISNKKNFSRATSENRYAFFRRKIAAKKRTFLFSMVAFMLPYISPSFISPSLAATPDDALVMAWNTDSVASFDPAYIGELVGNEIYRNVCDALVELDPHDETRVLPKLAESWEVSDEDGTKITFHLRDGLTFASGREAKAGDLAWGYHRVAKLNSANAAALNEYGLNAETIEQAITAPDDKTLVMKFARPYPANLILTALAANRIATLLDRETILANEQDGDLGNQYLTTRTECVGAYRLVQWHAGENIVLEANPNYWGEQPKLKRVLIRHVAEPGTQRLLLEREDVDVARNLATEDIADLEENTDIQIVRTLRPTLYYWSFNNADPILSNDKVRLAMRYLIDYDGLQQTILKGIGVARASFVQLGAFGALDEEQGQPFSLDLEKAKALLIEAGYENGFDLKVIIGTEPYASPITQTIQDNAAKIGVNLDIERVATAQLFSRVRGREFQTAMLGWTTNVPDAHGNASRQIYNPGNQMEANNTMYPSWRSAYFDETVNDQVLDALFEKDQQERSRKYQNLQHQMMERGPQAYIFQVYNLAALAPKLKNWTANGFRVYYSDVEK